MKISSNTTHSMTSDEYPTSRGSRWLFFADFVVVFSPWLGVWQPWAWVPLAPPLFSQPCRSCHACHVRPVLRAAAAASQLSAPWAPSAPSRRWRRRAVCAGPGAGPSPASRGPRAGSRKSIPDGRIHPEPFHQ